MNRSKYNTHLSMLDLLFLTCAGFSALFVLSYIQIKEKNETKPGVELKAEFIVTVTWPPEQDCDVDTYAKDPNGDIVFFKAIDAGLMHLDRDDLGRINDVVGENKYDENREILTIRGVISGEYVINVHMYSKRAVSESTPVTVRLEKINPYKNIITKTINLENTGDEKTAFRFVLNKQGDVIDINHLDCRIATSQNTY